MPFDDRAAFLRAIAADPADDVPRLVFADWLQDHGDDDRAEFIRLQIKLSNTDEDDPARLAMESRERELLTANEKVWRTEPPVLSGNSRWGTFQRGFADALSLPIWHPICSAVFPHYPVNRLSLPGLPGPRAEDLVRFDPAMNVRELSISGTCWPVLLRSPSFPELRRLEIPNTGWLWARNVCGMRAFPKLESLSLPNAWIDTRLARKYLDAAHWGQLTELNLAGNQINADVLADPLPRRITSLNLSRNWLTGESMEHPLRRGRLGRVRRLGLSGNPLGDSGAGALAAASMRSLTRLNVAECGIGNDGIRDLTGAKWWPNLIEIELSGNPIDGHGIRHLLDSDTPRLQALTLRNVEMCDTMKAALRERFGGTLRI